MIKTSLLIFSLSLMSCFSASAQTAGTDQQLLFNTWYEWPHEGTNGQTVYKTEKYLPVPGIDKQDELFKMLTLNAEGKFISSQYCGYCPNTAITEQKNSFEMKTTDKTTELKIYSDKSKQGSLVVISVGKDKLVLSATK